MDPRTKLAGQHFLSDGAEDRPSSRLGDCRSRPCDTPLDSAFLGTGRRERQSDTNGTDSASTNGTVDLSRTSRRGYTPGRSYAYRTLWLVVEALVMLNPVVTTHSLKRCVLRRFGARVGRAVLIKPAIHIKYPWHLEVGDNVWIGERAWIDNLVSASARTRSSLRAPTCARATMIGRTLAWGSWSNPSRSSRVRGLVPSHVSPRE